MLRPVFWPLTAGSITPIMGGSIIPVSDISRSLRETVSGIGLEELEVAKRELKIRGNNVCLYTGAMYPMKRIPFLIQACCLIREVVPDFEMIFMGAGEDADLVQRAASEHEWMRYLGPVFGDDKAVYYRLAKLALMPGLVGLTIVDSFALETPLVATAVPYHSPEIEYLKNGINGVMVPDVENPKSYAMEVIRLLRNDQERDRLINGCRQSAQVYTIENMVANFVRGIQLALKS